MTMRQPVIRVFNGNAALPLTGYGEVEVAFGQHGPDQARITVPRLVGGAVNPLLRAGSLFPQGEGVLVEIDARALGTNEASATVGVPDVWLGRVTDPDVGDGTTAEVELALNGPMTDLGETTIPVRAAAMSGPAGVIAAELVRSHPVDVGVDVGTVHRGRYLSSAVDGRTLGDALEGLAADSGEDFMLVALPGLARWRLDWTDALAPTDYTGAAGGPAVTIVDDGHRQNARVSLTYGFTRSRSDIVVAGAGWDYGGPLAVRAQTATAVLGRRAALDALVSTSVVQSLGGGNSAGYRPDVATVPMLEAAAAAQLRRMMRPVLPFQAEVLDTGMWPYMRPLALVLVRLADEVTGLYANAIAQIRTATFSVTAPYGCTISGELWSTQS
jgi:hypothetical protein